jgi:hypothetical protein
MIRIRDLDAKVGLGVPHQKVATFDGAQMETIRIASRNIEGRGRGAAVEDQDLDALRRLGCKRAKRGVDPLLAAVCWHDHGEPRRGGGTADDHDRLARKREKTDAISTRGGTRELLPGY